MIWAKMYPLNGAISDGFRIMVLPRREAISAVTGGCVPISFLDGEIPGVSEDALRPAVGTDLFGYVDPDAPKGGMLSHTGYSNTETFDSFNTGRRIRSWLRFIHTGEAGGIPGQTIAGIASAGAAVLVWTGLMLAWRRFRSWRQRSRPEQGQPVSDASAWIAGREYKSDEEGAITIPYSTNQDVTLTQLTVGVPYLTFAREINLSGGPSTRSPYRRTPSAAAIEAGTMELPLPPAPRMGGQQLGLQPRVSTGCDVGCER